MLTIPYTIGPFGSDLLDQAKVSPEAVWEGARTRFPHPGRGQVSQAEMCLTSQISDRILQNPDLSVLSHPCL